MVAAVSLWFGGPAAFFAWQVYRHGPPTPERLPVGRPVATLHYGPAPQQVGELRVPAGRGPFPVAVVIHGGCRDALIGGIAPLVDALTQRGVATLNVEYRQHGQAGGGWRGTFRDAGAAIDSLRSLARRYPPDLGRGS